ALLLLAQLMLAAGERVDDALAFGHILKTADGADERAALVEQRHDIDLNHHSAAVGALDADLLVADRLTGPQNIRHACAWQFIAAGPEKAALFRELFVGLAGLRHAAPKFGCSLVVLDDPAG